MFFIIKMTLAAWHYLLQVLEVTGYFCNFSPLRQTQKNL